MARSSMGSPRVAHPGTEAAVPALSDRAAVAAYRLGWSAVRRLPARAAYRMFDAIAVVSHRRGGKSVDRMRANYARVRPELTDTELDALVAEGLRSYFRYWCEAFRLPDLTPQRLGAMVDVQGDAPVRADLDAGRGVVCFLAHLGNWDLAGAWSTTHLSPVTTVAERLKPDEVYEAFLAFRERLGMTILPLTGQGAVFGQLVEALRAGALVPLLADRDLTSTGIEVRLAGHAARVAPGPAALAMTTGCALYPVSTRYVPDPRAASGHRLLVTFHDRVRDPGPRTESAQRVAAMTQACLDALSAVIVEHTAEWHMMQRVFVGDLDGGARTGDGGARTDARTGTLGSGPGGARSWESLESGRDRGDDPAPGR